MRFLAIGDIVCDKYVNKGVMYPGGTALNAAVYARMQGAQSAWLGVLGSDPEGQFLKEILKKKGIDWSRARLYEGVTTSSQVEIRDGERVFLGANGFQVRAAHPLILDDADLEYISGFDAVHTSLYSGTEAELPRIREFLEGKGSVEPAGRSDSTDSPDGCTDRVEGQDVSSAFVRRPLISFDLSDAWQRPEYLKRVCPYVDMAFLSCADLSAEDALALCKDIAALGPSLVIATRGGKSVIVWSREEEITFEYEPVLVRAVDTLGAGDSFAASFELNYQLGLFNSRPLEDSVRDALKVAGDFSAKVCLMDGAFGCGRPLPES